MKLVIVLAAVLVTLAGCGGSSAPDSKQTASAPKRETVFDPLTSNIGRAQGVQQTVDDQAAEQRRRIDEAAQ